MLGLATTMRKPQYRIRTLMLVVAATALAMGFSIPHVRFILATQADAAPAILEREFVLLVTLPLLGCLLVRCVRAVRMESAHLRRLPQRDVATAIPPQMTADALSNYDHPEKRRA